AGGVVRGTTITVKGTAACSKETTDDSFPDEGTSEPHPEAITEVAVRFGFSGVFRPANPTGPVSGKRWTTWTTGPPPITGVENDRLSIAVRVSAELSGSLKAQAQENVAVTVDRTPPVLSLSTPDEMTQPVENGQATFQLAGAAHDDLSPIVAVEWVLD